MQLWKITWLNFVIKLKENLKGNHSVSFVVTCWIFGMSRNNILFQEGLLSKWDTLGRIKYLTWEWFLVKLRGHQYIKRED